MKKKRAQILQNRSKLVYLNKVLRFKAPKADYIVFL